MQTLIIYKLGFNQNYYIFSLEDISFDTGPRCIAREDCKDKEINRVSVEREFFIDNLLVRIHLIIEMILVDRPCTMGV